MDERTALLNDIADFLNRTGMARTTFGLKAVNDGKFVARLASGGSVTLRTLDRVRGFIDAAGNASRSHGSNRGDVAR